MALKTEEAPANNPREYPYMGKHKDGHVVIFDGPGVGFMLIRSKTTTNYSRYGAWDEKVFSTEVGPITVENA